MAVDRRLLTELTRFLVIGGLAYVVDVGVSNLLVYGAGGLVPAVWATQPLAAKIVSSLASMVVAWIGNKAWTFGHNETTTSVRRVGAFVAVNLVSMGLALLPLVLTWHVLGWRGPLAYNLSTNVVGMVLAMSFRFVAYRRWVFAAAPSPDADRRTA